MADETNQEVESPQAATQPAENAPAQDAAPEGRRDRGPRSQNQF